MRVSFLLFLGLTYGIAFSQGNITYTLNQEANPTADQLDAYQNIKKGMDSSLVHYNRYTTQTKHLQVYYNTGVPTADASFNGTIRFGSNRSYMAVGTSMHEIAHTLGIGTTTEYQNLIQNGVFTGANATKMIRDISGDQSAQLKGDGMHFWPNGINYASEVKSEQDLINHCKMVEAIVQDLFHESLYFTGRIRSKELNTCMQKSGNEVKLGACNDSASIVRIIQMGESNVQYRMQFGNVVLDVPNESTAAGIVLGLYAWNGGNHQRFTLESQDSLGTTIKRIRMVHSGLYLLSNNGKIEQNQASVSPTLQSWELLPMQDIPTWAKTPKTRTQIRKGMPAYVDLLGRTFTSN